MIVMRFRVTTGLSIRWRWGYFVVLVLNSGVSVGHGDQKKLLSIGLKNHY